MSKELNSYKKVYKEILEISKELESRLNNIDKLTAEEIDELNKEAEEVKKYIIKIKTLNKNILNKAYTKRALSTPKIKSKLKDKDSYEFNEVLLYQGKTAKSFDKLEVLAKKGDIESQFLIGKTYLNGVIGYYGEIKMKDVGLGLKWLTTAYKKGHLESGFLIASYEKSVLNTKGAIKIFEQLGKKGHKASLQQLVSIYKYDPLYENMERVLDIKRQLS